MESFKQFLLEQMPPPGPMGGGDGMAMGLGGPAGMRPPGMLGQAALPGGMGAPPLGGAPLPAGGPPPGNEPAPVPIKTINVLDVWNALEHAAKIMSQFRELHVSYRAPQEKKPAFPMPSIKQRSGLHS